MTNSRLVVEVTSQALPEWDESINAGTCRSLKIYHGMAWSDRMRFLLGYEPLFFTVSEGGRPMLRLIACIVKPWRMRGLGNGLRHLIPAIQRGCTGSLLWNGEPVMTGPATAEHYRQLSVHLEQEAQQRWLHVAAGAWPAVHENVLAKSCIDIRGQSHPQLVSVGLQVGGSRINQQLEGAKTREHACYVAPTPTTTDERHAR